jgi:hypothetical protein
MPPCCPPRIGCNAPAGGEQCVLTLCRLVADEEPEAALALERWEAWQQACKSAHGGDERRFRRRSYERARDCALGVLLRAQLTVPGSARSCAATAATSRLRLPGSLVRRSGVRLGRASRSG